MCSVLLQLSDEIADCILSSFPANQMAHITCGGCFATLMYPSGAPSVKCAVCQFLNATGVWSFFLFFFCQ